MSADFRVYRRVIVGEFAEELFPLQSFLQSHYCHLQVLSFLVQVKVRHLKLFREIAHLFDKFLSGYFLIMHKKLINRVISVRYIHIVIYIFGRLYHGKFLRDCIKYGCKANTYFKVMYCTWTTLWRSYKKRNTFSVY